eukprot:2220967-Amphidinium_carterae.2
MKSLVAYGCRPNLSHTSSFLKSSFQHSFLDPTLSNLKCKAHCDSEVLRKQLNVLHWNDAGSA